MNEKFYQYSDPDRIKAVIDTLAAVTEPERSSVMNIRRHEHGFSPSLKGLALSVRLMPVAI